MHQARISRQAAYALGRRRHFFERRGKHRPQGDIAGAHGVGAHHFCVAVRAHPQPQARGLQGLQLAGLQGVEVFLPEVDAIGPSLNGLAPMVVDEQQRLRALHRLHGCCHLARHGGAVV